MFVYYARQSKNESRAYVVSMSLHESIQYAGRPLLRLETFTGLSVPNVCLEMRKRDSSSAAPVAWNLLEVFLLVFFSICDLGHNDLSLFFILLMLGSEIILSVTVICCVSLNLFILLLPVFARTRHFLVKLF